MKKTAIILSLLLCASIVTAAGSSESSYSAMDIEEIQHRELVELVGGSYELEFAVDNAYVTILPFEMAAYETSYALWYAVYDWAEKQGYTIASAGNPGSAAAADIKEVEYEPVTGISWRDALVWCNAYSEMTGLDPVYRDKNDTIIKDSSIKNNQAFISVTADYEANGYRLPFEGEWVYAASFYPERNACRLIHPSGIASYANIDDYEYDELEEYIESALKLAVFGSYLMDYDEEIVPTGHIKTAAVGSKQANALGLYDMTGNVWELCWDYIGERARTIPHESYGPEIINIHLRKGGAFDSVLVDEYLDEIVQITSMGYASNNTGFRVARNLPLPQGITAETLAEKSIQEEPLYNYTAEDEPANQTDSPAAGVALAEMEGKTVLKVAMSFYEYSEEAIAWNKIVDAFHAAYPDIYLDIEEYDSGAYEYMLETDFASGMIPDVMLFSPAGRNSFLLKDKLLANLEGLIDLSAWDELALQTQSSTPGIFTIPSTLTMATSAVYVNEDILNELGLSYPETYDELVAMSPLLKDAGYETAVIAGNEGWVLNICLLSSILGRIAGPDWIIEAERGEHSFLDREFVDALTAVQNMYNDGILSDSSNYTDYSNAMYDFMEGRSAFLFDGGWRQIELEGMNFSIKPLPAFNGENYPGTMATVPMPGMAMHNEIVEEKKQAALALIEFYAGKEAAEINAEILQIIPSLKDFEITDPHKHQSQMQDYFKSIQATATVDLFLQAELNDALNYGLQQICRGEKTPQQLALELNALEKELDY